MSWWPLPCHRKAPMELLPQGTVQATFLQTGVVSKGNIQDHVNKDDKKNFKGILSSPCSGQLHMALSAQADELSDLGSSRFLKTCQPGILPCQAVKFPCFPKKPLGKFLNAEGEK